MKLFLILALSFSSFITFSSADPWKILSNLTFEIKFDAALDDFTFIPTPDKAIQELAGKEIVIRGFTSTFYAGKRISATQSTVVLCRYKEHGWGCCTGVGPESLIEITPKESLDLVEGKPYIFKGTLVLNTKDYLSLTYQLKDAACLNCDSDNN